MNASLNPIAKAAGFQPAHMFGRTVPSIPAPKALAPKLTIRTGFQAQTAPETLALAIDGATLLTAPEINTIVGPLTLAVEAFRTGRPIYMDWVRLCTAVNVGTAIDDQGVVRGLRAEFDAAFEVLDAIGARMGTLPKDWKPGPLWANELQTMRDLVRLHKFQLQNLSCREFHRARQQAVGRVRSAGGMTYENGASGMSGRSANPNNGAPT